jgi:site-specific DNA-cytosine methylase
VVPIALAPGVEGWTTAPLVAHQGRWAHADLACGIGGFTVAAGRLGAATTWACDLQPEVVSAYNAAHASASGARAQCAGLEDRARWAAHAGIQVVSAGFPCQAFSRVGLGRGFADPRGQVVLHLVQLAWVLRPDCLVLECVWAFFEREDWLRPVCEAFREVGYGAFVRKAQVSGYLAQNRLRGILTLVRADHWQRATGPLRQLFVDSPEPWHPTVATEGVIGPDPRSGHALYLSRAQIALYSPQVFRPRSWPWEGYTRVVRPDRPLPTILRSYGTAAESFTPSNRGWHGFFVATGRGMRFLAPRELAVAQGFPWGFELPANPRRAWQALGNSIPPPWPSSVSRGRLPFWEALGGTTRPGTWPVPGSGPFAPTPGVGGRVPTRLRQRGRRSPRSRTAAGALRETAWES